jgi:hypothetical protein
MLRSLFSAGRLSWSGFTSFASIFPLAFLIDSRTLKFKKKFNFVLSFSPVVKKP